MVHQSGEFAKIQCFSYTRGLIKFKSNFYRQIRNFIIDISDTTAGYVAGLHYQVAQATSLYNIAFYSSTAAGTTQQGICKPFLAFR